MIINVNLKDHSYDIVIERNSIDHINEYIDFNSHQVMIVTDKNIPSIYYEKITSKIKNSHVIVLSPGESTKSIDGFCKIQNELLKYHFSRKDYLIALGGGVIGDLTGFVASTYKRGIPFINIPTSSLSMIDSSIGGKTAINFDSLKNVIGTFYQPQKVIIDFNLLSSLPERQLNNGLIEALKAGYIYDSSILSLFNSPQENIEEIICKSILVKKHFVEEDEKEESIRMILNYGHTLGHALEAKYLENGLLLHGEAVGIGMLMLGYDKDNLIHYLHQLKIKFNEDIDVDEMVEAIKNDKKSNSNYVNLIKLKTIGEAYIEKTSFDEIRNIITGGIENVRCFRK